MTLPTNQINRIPDTGDWGRADGFLNGPASEPLVVGTDRTSCVLYAEVFAPRRFDLILRKTPDATVLLAVDRNAATCEFQFGDFKKTISFAPGLLDGNHRQGQVLIEARIEAADFRVRLNGQLFVFIPDDVSGAVPATGDVAIQSHSAVERWAWVSLAEEPRLAVGGLKRYHWDLPPEELVRRAPYVLLSLSEAAGKIGDEITATGSGFTEGARVEIGGQLQEILFVAADTLRIRIAPDSGSGPLSIYDATAPEVRTVPVDFRVRRQPAVSGVVPELVSPGETFRIFGNHLTEGETVATVELEGLGELEVVAASPKSLEVRTPPGDYAKIDALLTLSLGDLDPVTFARFPVTVQAWNYIDLIEAADTARWINGRDGAAGLLPFGSADRPAEGAARWLTDVELEDGVTWNRVLYTLPPDPEQRTLNGFYRDQTIPAGARLFLRFGFRNDARETDGVKFRIEFYDRGGGKWYTILPEVFKSRDGALERRVIDLSSVLPFVDENASLTGAFSLTLAPGSSSRGDHACWAECRVGYPRSFAPRLELGGNQLDFGVVSSNATGDRTLRVENTGSGPLVVESAVFSDDSFTLTGAPAFPHQIAPGAFEDFAVRFTPDEVAAELDVNATLTLTTNDADAPAMDVTLLAVIGRGELEVEPGSLDYGLVPSGVGTGSVKTLTLRNSGNGALTLNSVSSNNGAYSLDDSLVYPVALSAGETMEINVRFKPNSGSFSAVPVNGILTIATGNTLTASVTVNLNGSTARVLF